MRLELVGRAALNSTGTEMQTRVAGRRESLPSGHSGKAPREGRNSETREGQGTWKSAEPKILVNSKGRTRLMEQAGHRAGFSSVMTQMPSRAGRRSDGEQPALAESTSA